MLSFPHKASVEEVNFSVERVLDKNQGKRLAELTFIKEHKDIFITESIETGKTYLATALGHEASPKRIQGTLLQYSKAYGTFKVSLKQKEPYSLI